MNVAFIITDQGNRCSYVSSMVSQYTVLLLTNVCVEFWTQAYFSPFPHYAVKFDGLPFLPIVHPGAITSPG